MREILAAIGASEFLRIQLRLYFILLACRSCVRSMFTGYMPKVMTI